MAWASESNTLSSMAKEISRIKRQRDVMIHEWDKLRNRSSEHQYLCLNFTAYYGNKSPMEQYEEQYAHHNKPSTRGAAGARPMASNASRAAKNNVAGHHKFIRKKIEENNEPVEEGCIRLYYSLPGVAFEPIEIPSKFDTEKRGTSKLSGKRMYNFNTKFDYSPLDNYLKVISDQLRGDVIDAYESSTISFDEIKSSIQIFIVRESGGPMIILRPRDGPDDLLFCSGCVDDICEDIRGGTLKGTDILIPTYIDEFLNNKVSLCVENIEGHSRRNGYDEAKLLTLEEVYERLNDTRMGLSMKSILALEPITVDMPKGSPWLFHKV